MCVVRTAPKVPPPPHALARATLKFQNLTETTPTPPPFVIATPKYGINTVPTPTVAITPRLKKRRLHGELVQERGI